MFDYTNGLRRWAWPISRAILPLGTGFVCLWILQQRLGVSALADIGGAIGQLHADQWFIAALATGVSFWAIGRYDIIIHRHIGTRCNATRAGIVGAASIALGQVLGMGVITSALVRWRMLKGLSPLQATGISLAVTGSFFCGLLGTIAAVTLLGPVKILPEPAAAFVVFSIFCIALRSFLKPAFNLFGRKIRLLTLKAMAGIMILTLIDTAAAALALWVLMPEGIDVGFAVFFPVYLVALSAALVTGTPGGVGPFELTILVFLPLLPNAELMAGIVAFRLIYYAIPGVIAMLVLLKPFALRSSPPLPHSHPMHDELFQNAPRAELAVCRQNGASLIYDKGTVLAVATTSQAQVALFDPLRGIATDASRALFRLARETNRTALIYKTSARHAVGCRNAGMKVLHIADEAVLNPAKFSLDGSRFRQLRRKLRQAEKSGITIRRAQSLPVAHLRAIDAEWQARSGGAHGFSMGRFCPAYLCHQRVYLAYHQEVLVGFASFHVSADEICLDLMRPGADAPNGTMHMVINKAIQDAAREDRTRLSLAALPPRSHKNLLFPVLFKWFGDQGLTRFKTSFAPRREPLYALSQSWTGMALTLLDVAMTVRSPDANPVHIKDEDYGFALRSQS